MTVGELREKLKGVADDVEVVGMGHFGEGVRVSSCCCGVHENVHVGVAGGWRTDGPASKIVFEIPVADIGEDPD